LDGTSLNPQIVTLGRENLDDAIEVLFHSLVNDPLPHYLFETSNVDYQHSLRELFRFSCEVRLDLDWPLLGCIFNSALAGVAGLSEPEEVPWPESLSKTYRKMRSVIGPQAIERLERYSEIVDSYRPEDPHFYLGVLGVHPSFQGRGLGALLMKEINSISAKHLTSMGVGLDTENPINVRFYERFGYRVVAHMKIDGIDLWSMFRPDPEGGER
jgi:ribosomal protein S18 acetylase RimI-like enzyme